MIRQKSCSIVEGDSSKTIGDKTSYYLGRFSDNENVEPDNSISSWSQSDHALVTHHEGASGSCDDSEIFPNYIKQLTSISEASSPFLL